MEAEDGLNSKLPGLEHPVWEFGPNTPIDMPDRLPAYYPSKGPTYIQLLSQAHGAGGAAVPFGPSHKWPIVLDIIGKIWASPVTLSAALVGLILVGLSRLIYGEGKITISNNAINFITSFNLGGAITFGNTVIYAMKGKGPEYTFKTKDGSKMNMGMHEEAHTYQYQLLGILFFIPYLLF